jgi:nicotinate-nucleotide adenylyltransferase
VSPRRARGTRRGRVRRLGVLGGTFDPPHHGHLAFAEWARSELRLDRVLFVPAGTPPHKRAGATTSAAHRLAMTRAAVRGNPAFGVSAIEVRRRGPSYTADTVRALAARDPGARLFLLMGADMYATFASWREPDEIARRARLVVALRPGTRPARGRGRGGRGVTWLANPTFELSSTALRERARRGGSLRYLVPDAVTRYVARHGLYARRRRPA